MSRLIAVVIAAAFAFGCLQPSGLLRATRARMNGDFEACSTIFGHELRREKHRSDAYAWLEFAECEHKLQRDKSAREAVEKSISLGVRGSAPFDLLATIESDNNSPDVAQRVCDAIDHGSTGDNLAPEAIGKAFQSARAPDIIATWIANRGFRIEEDIRQLRLGGFDEWTSLASASVNPQWARGKHVIARLKFSRLGSLSVAGALLGLADEWKTKREVVAYETTTRMIPTVSHTTAFGSGGWSSASTHTMVPVPEANPVWATRVERTGLRAQLILKPLNPNFEPDALYYVFGTVQDWTKDDTGVLPVIEVRTMWSVNIER